MCHWFFCQCSIFLCDYCLLCGDLIFGLLVVVGLWVLVLRHSCCHSWCVIGFFVDALSCCVIIETQRVEVRSMRQSPLMRGRSLRPSRLKSIVCDKVLWWGANHVGPAGWSPLYVTSPPMRDKSCWPSGLKSVVCDKILRWGANHVGPAGPSPLYVTKSSNEGHDLRSSHSQWRVISCQIDDVTWHNILCFIRHSHKDYSHLVKCISDLEACLKVRCTWKSPPTRGMILEVVTPNDEWYHVELMMLRGTISCVLFIIVSFGEMYIQSQSMSSTATHFTKSFP